MERRLILQDDLSDGYTSENAIIRDLELSENYSEDLNTPSPIRTTKRLPTSTIVRRKGRRSKVPIDDSFVEIKVQTVVDLLKASPFLKDHSLEPTIGSNDGIKLLGGCMPSYLFTHPRVTSKSVYWVLIDDVQMKCRICGSVKSTQERAVGCVRSHLDHRPFRCSGYEVGCMRCGPEPWSPHSRFFSKALLDDHLKHAKQRVSCIECNISFRRDGMKRHWTSKHKDKPFPDNDYTKPHESTPQVSDHRE